jgi:O-antigen/teichoic acid export membrane protein
MQHKKLETLLNLASYIIIGASGILLNIIIVNFYNLETLGLFSQFLALYFICSQITTFGMHQSVLANIGHSLDKKLLVTSALIITFFLAILFSTIICGLLYYFNITKLDVTILYFVLILFSLNKVLTFALNGLNKMNKFAIANSTRVLLLLFSVVIHKFFNFSNESIIFAFLVSEAWLLLLLLIFCKPDITFKLSKIDFITFAKQHLSFGKYAMMSGFILDLNTKIDIIILSFFVSQEQVGVYAFAAMLAEGYYQFASVFRNLNSPKLSKILFVKKSADTFINSRTLFWQSAFVSFVGIFCITTYKLFVSYMTSDELILQEGFLIFAVYSLAVLFYSKWIILDNILILNKQPQIDNYIRFASLAVNVIFSVILSFAYGIIGAAIAIGLSIMTTSMLIKRYIS